MIEFPCDSCISRKWGYISCDSRYNCYVFEKWLEESSEEINRECGFPKDAVVSSKLFKVGSQENSDAFDEETSKVGV